jgi:hypothetical protein
MCNKRRNSGFVARVLHAEKTAETRDSNYRFARWRAAEPLIPSEVAFRYLNRTCMKRNWICSSSPSLVAKSKASPQRSSGVRDGVPHSFYQLSFFCCFDQR